MERQNTNYVPDKREQQNETIYNYNRPSLSMAEQLVSLQLVTDATAQAADRRPPIPNIGRTANRFGYDTTPAGISDVLVVDDSFSAQFGDFGGTESEYMGTAYPSIPQT